MNKILLVLLFITGSFTVLADDIPSSLKRLSSETGSIQYELRCGSDFQGVACYKRATEICSENDLRLSRIDFGDSECAHGRDKKGEMRGGCSQVPHIYCYKGIALTVNQKKIAEKYQLAKKECDALHKKVVLKTPVSVQGDITASHFSYSCK